FTLQRRYRLHSVRPADRLRAGFGHSEMTNLAFRDEILHGSGYIFNGHRGIDTMLIKKIDHVGLEPFKRTFGHLSNVRRLAVHAIDGALLVKAEPEFGSDNNLVAET